MENELIHSSKFLSRVLRHQPRLIGLELDAGGWAEVDELIEKANQSGRRLTRELLLRVVAENDKQRFSLSEDGKRIRANQGHSLAIDLGLPPLEPPALLYHGTAERNLEPILREGLKPGRRQFVHLSLDTATARNVGARHGRPVILLVQAAAMHAAGLQFFCSANGVWMTTSVPPIYLQVIDPPQK